MNFHPLIDFLFGWTGLFGPRHYIRLTVTPSKNISRTLTASKGISREISVRKGIVREFEVNFERDSI